MKQRKPKQSADIQNEILHVGVKLEAVHDDVKLVAEQYGGVKKEMGGIKKVLDSHTEMISELAVNVEIVKSDIEFIKHMFSKRRLTLMSSLRLNGELRS